MIDKKFIKIWKVLEAKHKRQIFFLIIISLTASLTDLIGIVSILPFLSVLINPELIETNRIILFIKSELDLNNKDLTIFFGLVTLFSLFINQTMKVLSQYYKDYVFENYFKETSFKVFNYYLSQSYSNYLVSSSANMFQKILVGMHNIIVGYIGPIFAIFQNLFTTLIIIFFLLLYEPAVTLIISFFLAAFYLLLFKKIKNKIGDLGKIVPSFFSSSSKVITDAFGSFKEIKINNNKNFFLSNYLDKLKLYTGANIKINLYSYIPSALIEVFLFGLILVVAVFIAGKFESLYHLIPLLGLLAMALKRIMPSMFQIYTNMIQIKYNSAYFDQLFGDYYNASITYSSMGAKKKIIERSLEKKINFHNVSYQFQNAKSKSLSKINTQIRKGEFIGVAGESGSGKTTFIDLLLGLLKPNSGKIMYDNNNLAINRNQILNIKGIGYAPQRGYLLDSSIGANVAFGKFNYKKVKRACEIAEISSFIEKNLKKSYNTIIGENGVRLSGGQIQRIIIARAIYNHPELIIMDEATNSLDSNTEKKIFNNIKKNFKSSTRILITHRLNTLKYCDKIILISNKKIEAEGSFKELKKNNKKFNLLLNTYNKNN